MADCSFGVVFSGNFPLQRSLSGAVLAEQLGFDSCWIGEDYFYHGGIATATAIAERTERIGLGLGVLSPVPRHPALTAMEVATVDEIAGGRVTLGIGYGVPAWIGQMSIGCRSPLNAMREGVELCRRLMAGERISETGTCFSLDRVQLGFKPLRPDMPIYMGVEGPKGLQLSGEIADGTIISVLAGPLYLAWARENVTQGSTKSGRPVEEHRFVVYVIFSMDDDSECARQAVRHTIAEYVSAGASGGAGPHPLVSLGGVREEVYRQMGQAYREGRIPVELVDDAMVGQLAVSGNPDECEAGIRRLIEAGASSIVFFPFPSDQVEQQLERISRVLLPRLKAHGGAD
jgi:alkanesulfonate monooxygenase SsuD/methylene tetrahydromethanopterin reductase-like flavin-dependent oxidoreductase (luciferase family)